jgi:polysaccharide deacetylase 2 family uncharacterized protein YibQ
MAIPLAGMAFFLVWQRINDGITPRQLVHEVRGAATAETVPLPAPVAADPVLELPETETPLPVVRPRAPKREPGSMVLPPPPADGERGRIVLIIDDLGFEGQPLDTLMALDPNVNAAILPNSTRAAEVAERLNERGFEILVHLPMQPRGSEAPGKNAIRTDMHEDEIARLTRENIEAVPHARGVNNHMGSLATSDRRVMTSVLSAMPASMYFIDSRTGGRSVAQTVAREQGIPTAARHVFLDDVITETAVRAQLAELATLADRHGVAIGIGHPHRATMNVLREEMPKLRAAGFRFVRASEVVR